MAVQRYWSDDATITLNDDAGSPAEVPTGSLKGVSVTFTAEHVQLFSGDTIEREAVKKRQAEVPVEISIAAFDTALAQKILAGDSTSTGNTSLTDTSDVALFNLTGTFTSVDGGNTVTVDVDDIYFEEYTIFDASEGEYIIKDLSGTGKTISDISEA